MKSERLVPCLVKKCPAFKGTQSFIPAFTKARNLSLSYARTILSTPSRPIYSKSILILYSQYCYLSKTCYEHKIRRTGSQCNTKSRSLEFYPDISNDKLPGGSFRLDLLSPVPSHHETDIHGQCGRCFLRRTSGATVSAGNFVMSDYVRSGGY